MTVTFDPPGPGPWQQDQAHLPRGFSPLLQDLYPPQAMKGFAETFARWGALLDGLAWGLVNGFPYHQPQPFDLPGPDGPMAPEAIGAEIGRRAAVAEAAFANKIWRGVLERWDNELKPAAVARHRELGDVELTGLDDDELREHVDACIEHMRNMAYLHHRFNGSAVIPTADFALQVAGWVGQDPILLFGVFDGHSPASGVVSPELAPAVEALRADAKARERLCAAGEPGAILDQLRAEVPEVDEYVRSIGFRLVDGFDVLNLTTGECPQIVLGRLAAGLDVEPDEARRRADQLAESLRVRVPEEHRAAFDELLAEGRHAYRLRDERGLYSDISAIGLLRLALLECGRRLANTGRLVARADIFELHEDELAGVLAGADAPTAEELADRAERRRALMDAGAPRHLGPPPPEPPPLDQLPPSLARVMAAIGFGIDGILGELDAPAGTDDHVVGIPGNSGVYEGTVHIVENIDDLLTLEDGDVLVAKTTGEAFNSMIHLVGAIVTDHGSFSSHAAIVARECGFPAVVGCVNATSRLVEGQRVRVDGATGQVDVLT